MFTALKAHSFYNLIRDDIYESTVLCNEKSKYDDSQEMVSNDRFNNIFKAGNCNFYVFKAVNASS